MGQGSSKAELADLLVTLSQTDVSPDAHEFWDELWKLSTTPEDVFELISPDDVRQLKTDRPENVVTLFTQAVAQLCQIVHTPVAIYFGQALNCVRILTRLLPFLLEDAEDDFVRKLCWEVDAPAGGDDGAEPLARLVVHATLHLLFLPAFTVDSEAFEDEAEASLPLAASALWTAGVGAFDATPAAALSFDRNRVEVIRLFLAAVCEPLYQSAEAFDPWRSKWLAVAAAEDAPNAKLLLYSLLNTICAYDPTGFGVPYGGQLASDAPMQLVHASAQLLIVLLDHGTPANDGGDGVNVYRNYLGEIRGAQAYDFIFEGLARLLNNVHEALSTTLPGSLQEVECYQELLVLLWKLLEENGGFMNHMLRHCDVTRLVVPICFLQYHSRLDAAKVGLVHICTFVLLKLSGERQFCVALNKELTVVLPLEDLPLLPDCTHADLVIVTLHKLVVTGGDKLAALYNCFLTIIANLSPYAKALSLVASVKLVNLFELFTSKRFLYATEGNHAYVALLLEIFNNVVQYQYAGNAHLVYAIVRRHAVFSQLEHLSLPEAVADAATQHHARTPADGAASDAVEGSGIFAADAAADSGAAPPSAPPRTTKAPAFVPSASWLEKVQAELPLATMMRLLHHLVPQIDALVAGAEFALDEAAILEFLSNTTMVGLLPVPHAIVIRKYQPNTFTSLWFTAFMWGIIFLQNQQLPLFDGASIKLFTVSVV